MGYSSAPEGTCIFTRDKINKVFWQSIRLYYMGYVSRDTSISQLLLRSLYYDKYKQ
jgi:hypothetical protein